MQWLRKISIGLLVGLIALFALLIFGIAYLVADTGYPGGISPFAEKINLALLSFLLGFAGWVVVWRRDVYVNDLAKTISGKWAVFWGAVTILIFWGAGTWLVVQAYVTNQTATPFP